MDLTYTPAIADVIEKLEQATHYRHSSRRKRGAPN